MAYLENAQLWETLEKWDKIPEWMRHAYAVAGPYLQCPQCKSTMRDGHSAGCTWNGESQCPIDSNQPTAALSR